MQTNLFGDAFPTQEKALARLDKFAFHDALDLLRQAKELNPEIPNNAIYKEIAEFCLTNHLHEDSPSAAIIDIWEMQHQEQAFAGHSSPFKKSLFRLFAQRLIDLDEFDENGVIGDAGSFFHISACYLHREKYEDARQALTNLLTGDKTSVPARYWGYYGDAALHVPKANEANFGYLRLFTSNPFDVDWSTFHHKGLKNLFRKLLLEHELQYAYGIWPFYAWVEGLIEIPKSNRYMSIILHNHVSGLNPELALTPFERSHRFSLFVFYEQSYQHSPDADMRMTMKNLDENLFQEYLAIRERKG